MDHQKPKKRSDCDSPPPVSQSDNHCPPKVVAAHKRKTEEAEECTTNNKKRTKTSQEPSMETKKYTRQNAVQTNATAVDQCGTDDSNDDVGSDASNTSVTKKRKSQHSTSPQFNKLQEVEDRSPLCVMGENEINIFPKKVNFMNHKIEVMYDSRVHMWFKADDFAKALGYKNYKFSIERYVHPSFVKTFPEVLDMSRARYGDAFRLYSVNSKVLFINGAGVMQLLLRSMISNNSASKEEKAQSQSGSNNNEEAQQEAVASVKNRGAKHHPKPKLSADWINYQILPSLVAFSEAARNGITAHEDRRLRSMNQFFNQ